MFLDKNIVNILNYSSNVFINVIQSQSKSRWDILDWKLDGVLKFTEKN